jgi:hypothetical protein
MCVCVCVCVKLDTHVLYSILCVFYSLLPVKFGCLFSVLHFAISIFNIFVYEQYLLFS